MPSPVNKFARTLRNKRNTMITGAIALIFGAVAFLGPLIDPEQSQGATRIAIIAAVASLILALVFWQSRTRVVISPSSGQLTVLEKTAFRTNARHFDVARVRNVAVEWRKGTRTQQIFAAADHVNTDYECVVLKIDPDEPEANGSAITFDIDPLDANAETLATQIRQALNLRRSQ